MHVSPIILLVLMLVATSCAYAVPRASRGVGRGRAAGALQMRAVSALKASGNARVSIFYNDVYEVVLPDSHRFPMKKYRMVREELQHHYGSNPFVNFEVSPLSTKEELVSTHCPQYIDRFIDGNLTPMENRRIGFPWSPAGVDRSTSSVGGTVAAMRSVLSSLAQSRSTVEEDRLTTTSLSDAVSTRSNPTGFIQTSYQREQEQRRSENGDSGGEVVAACHVAGGTHHAFYDRGKYRFWAGGWMDG
jgi:hypothetical protein